MKLSTPFNVLFVLLLRSRGLCFFISLLSRRKVCVLKVTDLFLAGIFPAEISPLGLFPAGSFPARSFLR